MTAGVQHIDQTAYLPSPPSASMSDAKASGGSDTQTSGTSGEPQNFQSELALQGGGAQATKPASDKPGSDKPGSARPASDKSGKKQDTKKEDPNSAKVTPVQVAEPQKQILPLVLALPKPDEDPQPDEHAAESAPQDQQALHGPSDVKTGNAAKTAALPQPAERLPNQIPAANAGPTGTPDPSQVQTQVQILTAAAGVPVPDDATQSQDPSKTSANPGASTGASKSQPVSRAELKLPDAMTPEPVAAAVQKTVDSASSSPSALAFAARMTATSQKSDQSAPESPSQPAASSTSSAPARIPVRYAATAQILQNDEPNKDAGAAIDRPARTDARTDMVVPRIEVAREAPPSSGSPASQQAAPTARTERVIEPPAAPPTSANDIRVQVPDHNGGSTQVRFVESGGEVRVSVRTADEGLAQNLRSHLNDLSQRLSDGGIPAEIWKPGSSAASSQNNQPQPDREGRGSGGQQSGGQGGQQDRQEQRPAWLEEMETSLHGPQE